MRGRLQREEDGAPLGGAPERCPGPGPQADVAGVSPGSSGHTATEPVGVAGSARHEPVVSARSAPARVVRGEPWVVEGLGVIFIGNNVSTNELQLHARLGTSVAAYHAPRAHVHVWTHRV
jgi:hypothetical protein